MKPCLIIIDEAHYGTTTKETGDGKLNYRTRLDRLLKQEPTPALICMTATPFNNDYPQFHRFLSLGAKTLTED